ncbi:NAD(P)/FAD-dependent oxidoreductase [Agrococcus sp. Marseille-P2731]|uniref:NAD(P)/FAD-dependent oxidoreductase n=1 Tax=Agrococcus sp. Marseille-P2731 TaxID=1841862 RepID=UPI000930764C|nr:FAD/NAD(P)-binding oxidoreductase [Agrococcus sp. Marseille-P2731]
MASEHRHDVLIIGGGNGGISAAAHLQRRGCRDIALIDPVERHVYKPLQHYVGTGIARDRELTRSQASLMPAGVDRHRTTAVEIDPVQRTVRCADGTVLRAADIVLAPGMRIDWEQLPGATRAIADGTAVSTFVVEELERTRERLEAFDGGRALFHVHDQPASGLETAFKPLFIACDLWRSTGVLERTEVVLVHEGARLHRVDAIEREIRRHLDDYGVDARLGTRLVGIEGDIAELDGPAGRTRERADLIQLHPPYAAAAVIADSGLDGPTTGGFAAVDPETLRHPEHPRIWAIGDGADLGDARTGGALRKQVKVVVENIRRSRAGLALERYDGYTVAPIATSRRSLSFGEYDRALRVRRSLPVPDEIRSSPLWHVLDRFGLPQAYWHRILRGRL